MAFFGDSVPRDLYDDLQRRYDDLLNKYHSLRPTHAPVAPMRMVPPAPSGEVAVAQMGAAFGDERLRGIAARLMAEKPELSAEAALVEAKRLDDIARGRALPPQAGA